MCYLSSTYCFKPKVNLPINLRKEDSHGKVNFTHK